MNTEENKVTAKTTKTTTIAKPKKTDILPANKVKKTSVKQEVSLANALHATGKRKSCVAKAWLDSNGSGEIYINNQKFEDFFGPRPVYKSKLTMPFRIALLDINQFNIRIFANGGGKTGFIDAIKLALSKCIITLKPAASKDLKDAKLLTRDNRVVESKKYGRRKARKKEQYSKR